MSKYLRQALTPATQNEKLPGQISNSDGCAVFPVDEWTRLDRFLILGSEGGSYYASEQKLTRENARNVEACLTLNGPKTVARIVEISESGRAPKNDPAILALAMAAKLGDDRTRALAYAAVPKVCRIGTHLYHFVQFANDLGGWGRGLRRAVGDWFNRKDVKDLAYQLVKYQSRDGWSSRDLLRLSHPTPATPTHNALYQWATKGEAGEGLVGTVIAAFERAKKATDVGEIVQLIKDYKLPREAIPTQFLTEKKVWEAQLPHMGLTALIRNLANMTRSGLFEDSDALALTTTRITDPVNLAKSRVHPMAVLTALLTYKSGRSLRGQSTWTPKVQIIDALDASFYAAFGNVTPTGKRIMLALDVSGSMGQGDVGGVPGLSPRMASAAMAMVTAAADPNGFRACGFSNRFIDLDISPRRRLDDNIRAISGLPFANTDCSLPMRTAMQERKHYDGIVIYTDSETNAYSQIQPAKALQVYRREFNLQTKFVVVGMVANAFSVADPNDAGMLDLVGFDTAAPNIISDFIRGESRLDTVEDRD